MRGDAVLAKVGFDNRGIQLSLKSSPRQKARRNVRVSRGVDTIAPSAPELAKGLRNPNNPGTQMYRREGEVLLIVVGPNT
jgi:hypothetical protein